MRRSQRENKASLKRKWSWSNQINNGPKTKS